MATAGVAVAPASPPAAGVAPLQPRVLYAGLAVASIGGPLAFVGLYLPAILAGAGRASVLATGLGLVAFAAPTYIWIRYSRTIVGPGGLTAFTAAAAGRKIAGLQAIGWLVSYVLYLLYTTDYVVYDVLTASVPGIGPWRPWLEVAIPAVLAGVVLAPLRASMTVVATAAAAQVGVLVVLLGVATAHAAAAATAAGATDVANSGGNVALLFVCGSLPLFLGGEVRGGGRTVRRTLVGAVVAVGVLVAFAATAAHGLRAFAGADIPGVALARDTGGTAFGVTVGAGIAVSVLALVVVEYLAITRVVHAVAGGRVRTGTVARWLVAPLVGAGAISLLGPARFYADLLEPSLVALWIAQLIPVLVYPRYALRSKAFRPYDAVAVAVATALFGFGLYTSLGGSTGT